MRGVRRGGSAVRGAYVLIDTVEGKATSGARAVRSKKGAVSAELPFHESLI
jgi:hypothetical protein